MNLPSYMNALQQDFPQAVVSQFRGQIRMRIPSDELEQLLTALKQRYEFDMLIDVTCVDYLNYRDAVDRFGLVYVLLGTETNERLIVRTYLNEPDLTVPSAVPLWESANWMEREVYDMFGIRFAGHPDLRRILLPEEFTAFPLRKDYPLQGRGERHNFPVLTRESA
ncbi:MAG: NADH-quinone oxidoreductase subunit C [Planctomycetes bacterium]|nr:NADH-quinone oxidoreductase subunit C [Planctomycetota bacterium]